MIRSELVQKIGQHNPGLNPREVELIVTIFFDEITKRLADDGRVELRGFRRLFDPRTRRPHGPQSPHRRDRGCQRQARSLFQTRQGNARPPERRRGLILFTPAWRWAIRRRTAKPLYHRWSLDLDGKLVSSCAVRGRGETVDAADLKSASLWSRGSSPLVRTRAQPTLKAGFLLPLDG